MGTDRYMEERDACPSRLAAANARIVELERERDETLALAARVNKERYELRSAQAADRERVREVVETAAAAVLGPNGPLGARSWDVLAHQIATRVAVQLAAARPVLSEEEIQALERLRGGSTSLAFQAIRKIIAAYRGAP